MSRRSTKAYNELKARLADRLRPEDDLVLRRLVKVVESIEDLEAQIAKDGVVLPDRNNPGSYRRHPLLSPLGTQTTLMMQLCTQLGMSPMARKRIGMVSDTDLPTMADVLHAD